MVVSSKTSYSPPQKKPSVFVLHCGLDIKKVQRLCEKLELEVNITPFRREEVFAYYMRIAKSSPDVIVIRSHFRSLINSIDPEKNIPTIVVSTHQEPAECQYHYIQAEQGYDGPDSSGLYEQLCLTMRQALGSESDS